MSKPKGTGRPKCRYCPKRFDRVNAQQVFCSDECRRAFHQNGPAAARVEKFLRRELAIIEARVIAALGSSPSTAAAAAAYLDAHPERRALERRSQVLLAIAQVRAEDRVGARGESPARLA